MTRKEFNKAFKKYWKPYLKLTLDGLNWFQKLCFIRKARKEFYELEKEES